jgi:hypothetical protein
MTKRYEAQLLDEETVVLRYDLGYTKIECNSGTGKTIVRNITGDSHIPYQFDRVFDLGEYKKFSKHIVQETRTPNPGNPHSVEVVLVGAYLPKQAKKDIKTELGDSSLIGKYFK